MSNANVIESIEFLEEVDNAPRSLDGYDDAYNQGTVWTNWRVFKVTLTNGVVQYIKTGVTYNSYGDSDGYVDPQIVTPKTKTVQVWE